MFRMMFALFAVMLSWMFSPDDGGGSGDSGGGSGNNNDDGNSENSNNSGDGKTFSQEDVNRIAGQRATESAEAAQRRVADDLGVPLADAKRIIKEAQEREESQKSELEKEKTARQKAEERATKAETLANERFVSAELKGALRDAGINKDRISAAVKLADTDKLSVKNDSVDGLDTVVKAVKDGYPEWFEASSDNKDGKDKNGQSGKGSQQGNQQRAADANGQQTGGGRPKNLKQALQQHYGN